MKILLASLVTTASLLSNLVFAGDIAAGKAKAVVCGACHGADGKAEMPSYPNLAGQNAEYLKLSLNAYKNGSRTGGQAAIMTSMATPLTDADIDNLAAYFSSL